MKKLSLALAAAVLFVGALPRRAQAPGKAPVDSHEWWRHAVFYGPFEAIIAELEK